MSPRATAGKPHPTRRISVVSALGVDHGGSDAALDDPGPETLRECIRHPVRHFLKPCRIAGLDFIPKGRALAKGDGGILGARACSCAYLDLNRATSSGLG